MKPKQLALFLSVFALVTLMMGNAYATYDSHVHTGNGTIDSWPTITVTGTHKLRVCAPTIGRQAAATWISGNEWIDDVSARDGASATSQGASLTAGSHILFTSWVDGYVSGTGKAYLADTGTSMPNCSSQ